MHYFPRAGGVVSAAIELRSAMAPAGLPPSHTGIHAGRVIHRVSGFYGRMVSTADRQAALAGPGEILVTEELVGAFRAGGAELPGPVALEPLALKGIPQPVAAYRLGP